MLSGVRKVGESMKAKCDKVQQKPIQRINDVNKACDFCPLKLLSP